jgi:cystinosin
MVDHDALTIVSQVLGWIYFAAWSLSFYGQVIENFRRKSVSGLSFDFEVYNLTGFIGYSTYTIWGYVDPKIGTGTVAIQDVVFAVHAVAITILTIVQIFIYYDKTDPNQKVSKTCICVNICLWWGVFQILLIERVLKLYDPTTPSYTGIFFNSVVYLGWCKVFISLIKYIPQAVSNWRRKSTEGWNIHNILLDLTGGTFSFAQNIVDTINGGDAIGTGGKTPTLNIAKFALSVISVFFDIIFMTQHYILYRKTGKENEKRYSSLINNL